MLDMIVKKLVIPLNNMLNRLNTVQQNLSKKTLNLNIKFIQQNALRLLYLINIITDYS